MNKKRLSVVMAGAMLASSVAPVMAAKVPYYEVNGSNKGILIKELRELLTSKVFANVEKNTYYAGASVYEVRVGSESFYDVTESGIHGIKAMEEKIQTAPKGTKVVVVDRGHVEKNGKFYAVTLEDSVKESKFIEKDFTDLEAEFIDPTTARAKYKAIYDVDYDEESETLTVVSRRALSENELKEFTYKVGAVAVDFTKPVDGDQEVIMNNDWSKLEGFKVKSTPIPADTDIDEKVLAELEITNADETINFKLSELYDGLLLTEKGQELLDGAKLCKSNSEDGYKYSVSAVDRDANGLFRLTINFYDQNATTNKKLKKVVKIVTNNEAQLKLFRKWMVDAKAQVEVLAGSNRYSTAVKVAKENADIKDVAINGNIVLVNGDALVDGLAAAPLAASVWNKAGNGSNMKAGKVAPILLTEADSLPKATFDYMKELVAAQRVGNLDKVTVYLVGGEAVLSRTLERELKDLGVRVVRAGGEDREETSLEVAKLMKKENNVDAENAFIVGADGEADAMSIASVAAEKQQPIIVESRKGISEETIEYLKGYKATSSLSATIVGGEKVVSKATENTLKAEKVSVDRISGSNRQATNAEVINRFAKSGLRRLVVSKDGQNKKSELIDALTATSLAVKDNAPIVLATNKISNAQVNALEKKAHRDGVYVYQVGIGVSKDVLKQIATRIGLAK